MYSKKGNNPFGTVTFRLTLLYTVLFGTLSLAVFILVYVSLTSGLGKRTDDELFNTAREFESLYSSHGAEALEAEFKREAQSRGVGRVFFRLLSPSGDVILSSDLKPWKGIGGAVLNPPSKGDGRASFLTLKLSGQRHRVRVVSSLTGDGHVIQIGTTLADNELLMERYRATFGAAVLVMLISGALVGWLVAKWAMSGVQRVTRTAAQIGGKDLSRRVPLGREGREINDLVHGFNEMLERMETLVGELKTVSDNVAHDLRSPLTRIRGIAETTLTGPQEIKGYRVMAGTVIEESDRLVGMIDTILEIAKADSGIAEFAGKKVDLGEVAQEAADLFSPLAEDRGAGIDVKVPEEPVTVAGDVTRLQRVVANILDNAIKYSGRGGVVRLSLEADGRHANLRISDTGQGISERDMPRIFDRFYRGDRSRSTPGSGLGLSLALAIVRAHGGDIEVKSSPGKGSVFTVALPLLSSSPSLTPSKITKR